MRRLGGSSRFVGGDRDSLYAFLLFIILFLTMSCGVYAELGPENLLILVNSESATSRYVAKMYREYYPEIEDVQVLELSGLADCSGPTSTAADEIIPRDVYNTQIAEPVRQHLLDNNLLEEIMVIVTTAGMPYRIEDTTYSDVIYPAGSNYSRVSLNLGQIDAASVESELTCLWYADAFGLSNRMVNPYQGYRQSSITLFERVQPNSKSMNWTTAVTPTQVAPKMEGQIVFTWPPSYGTVDRTFHAGDIYLTCRLDGPKSQGQSAVYTVRRMLERSKRASNPASGVNPARGAIVIDDCLSATYDLNRVYNLDGSMNYYSYEPGTKQPPDAPTVLSMDDYTSAFDVLSSGAEIDAFGLSTGWLDAGHNLKVLLDRRACWRSSQIDLEPDESLLFLCCYGKNGDEGSASDYLTNGLDGGALFNPANGAVFTSIESFNALTMFSDLETAPVAQGKIIDFIAIGGTGAIGHAFEPVSSAAIDNVFLAYNLFADSDFDGRADLTFVEAAWTGIPFLSWAEVVIGDPLMRITYGQGEPEPWEQFRGDVNGDNRVNIIDIAKVRQANGGMLESSDPVIKDKYSDLCDINGDGRTNIIDIAIVRSLNGTVK